MGARPIRGAAGTVVPGVYERIRSYELTVALKRDPRLSVVGDNTARPVALTPPDRFSPTALGQPQALLEYKPVRVPGWYFGPRMYGDVCRLFPHSHRQGRWFTVDADDTIAPA